MGEVKKGSYRNAHVHTRIGADTNTDLDTDIVIAIATDIHTDVATDTDIPVMEIKVKRYSREHLPLEVSKSRSQYSPCPPRLNVVEEPEWLSDGKKSEKLKPRAPASSCKVDGGG